MNKIFTAAEPDWLPGSYSPARYSTRLTSLLLSAFVFITLIKIGNWLAGGTPLDLFDAIKCATAVLWLVAVYVLRLSARRNIDQLNVTFGELTAMVALARVCNDRDAKQAVPTTLSAIAYEFDKLSKYKLCLQSAEIHTIRSIWEYCRSVEALHQQQVALDASRRLTNTDG